MMVKRSSVTGFSLIEVLVALVIVLVSVLGIAGLLVQTTQQEAESYQRVQALILLQDMVNRLNANRQVASCYSNGGSGRILGTGSTQIPACASGTPAQRVQADADLAAWHNQLLGAAERTSNATNVGALIRARGCIALIDAAQQTYRITVAWQGLGATAAPNSSCGQGSYGSNDALRRNVNAVVRIGKLS